ncbi:cache domain-containing protein [Halomonas sp. M4R1S46]|uniref:cache domain-containing protein n=1 Tax=Halomonas sp. M4R1S46 TaxID=2982692 RepID=UPI0021E43249|nr:cache domain-containing protein [Halomonas sp. M4R1S46]UYG09146.1 cache domain-containing protein [Halomonas sp. M4R1S46]
MFPPPGPARLVFSTALVVAVVAFTIAVGLIWVDRSTRQQTTDDWRERIRGEATAAAESLNADMRQLSGLADELASELASGDLPVARIEARLEELVAQHPHVFGVGVMFRPYAYAPDRRLHAPYIVKRHGVHRMVRVEDVYDYTEPRHDWYHQGTARSGWLEPFFGQASQAMLALYCTPFRLPEAQRARDAAEADGTVCIDYSIEDVWDLVGALDLGETGYAFVITDQGTFVAHPRREYARQGQNLHDIADQLRDPVLTRLAQRATDLQSGAIAHSNELTGQDSWIFYRPITAPRWSLAVVAFTAEIPLDLGEHKHRQILIAIALIVGASGLIVLLLAYRLDANPALWSGSVAIALLFLVGVVHIWTLEFAEAGRDPPEAVMLIDRAGIESYLDGYGEQARLQRFGDPIRIPTGMFIQAIRFKTAHDFVVTGFAWQRYAVPEHDDLRRGIFFPDAIPEQDVREELFRLREGDSEVIGWYFKTTLHQPFEYSRFPIDIKTLRLRVWHPELARHIVLVPELEAYRLIHPTALPGMEPDFRLPGWQVKRSFFAYRFHDYRSDLGLRGNAKGGEFPELTYNVTLLRNITDAFISNQIPLFVAAVMLFAMLMIDTRETARASLYGFTTSTVLATSAAIFFIILLAHIDVRRRYAAEEIMYLEYFYFITYFTIVAVSINAFMLMALSDNRFFHYRDNLIPKLLFWPLLHGAFLVVTVYVFL